MRRSIFASVALAACLAASSAHAQQTVVVAGIVISDVAGQGLPFSTVSIAGGPQRFTGADGSFAFELRPGTYSLRVRQLGFSPLDTVVTVSAGENLRGLLFTLRPIAVKLDTLRVYSKACRAGGEDAQLSVLLDEVAKNADRERLLRTDYPFIYQIERRKGYKGLGGVSDQSADTLKYNSKLLVGYAPGNLVQRVDSTDPRSEREMRIPTLVDLADPAFIDSHCYRYRGVTDAGGARAYRIDFEPARDITTTDVAGSAFIDSSSFMIRKAVFRLTKPDKLKPPVYGLEVTTTYREIFKGLALFDSIHSEQPLNKGRFTLVQVQDQKLTGIIFYGRTPEDVVIADAAIPPPKPAVDSTARLAGIVVDSTGRRLGRAEILVADGGARTMSSDSGQFLLKGLKPGKTSFVVRALGFAPATFSSDLRATRTKQVRVILSKVTVQLSTIVVETTVNDTLLANTGFYDRKRVGFGSFITPQQIQDRNPSVASDLLRAIRGVTIRQASGFGTVPYSTRSPGGLGPRCVMNVFIDGIMVSVDSNTPLEDAIQGSEIGAVEVYAGASETPPKFLGASNGCGSIVFWTKGYLSAATEPDSTKHE
jgi:hypothetical protein